MAGTDLHWLTQNRGPELLGAGHVHHTRFPLLVKVLDARDKLSLQVHPPPAKASALGGEPKTELWYVAEAAPDAELYVGLKRGCTPDDFAAKLRSGTVAECFHRVRVRPGDAMFLPSGRVHALGAGMIIFEIQQNSDTTYRVFDWNRLGLDGRPRELHLQQSLESIDFGDFEPALLQPQPLPGPVRVSSLLKHPLFSVNLVALHAGQTLPRADRKMQILGVVSGELAVYGGGEHARVAAGHFCLVPASLERAEIRAEAPVQCLEVLAGEEVHP